jgi:phage host-nuclease inhibitor protein Gam
VASIGWAWHKAEEAAAAGSTTTVRIVSGRLEVRRGPPEIAAEAEAPAMAGLRSHVVGRKLARGIKDVW